MSFYVQTWLPLLTVALTAAICFSVASMSQLQSCCDAEEIATVTLRTPHFSRFAMLPWLPSLGNGAVYRGR